MSKAKSIDVEKMKWIWIEKNIKFLFQTEYIYISLYNMYFLLLIYYDEKEYMLKNKLK